MALYNVIWFGFNDYSALSGSKDIFANNEREAEKIVKSILLRKNITVETIRVIKSDKEFFYQKKNRDNPV
jgi:hypothetical protein